MNNVHIKTRSDALKFHMIALFKSEIDNSCYSEIRQLYDAAHVTMNTVLKQYDKHYSPLTNFYDAVYMDIAYVLVDEIMNNKNVKDLFINLYNKKYYHMKKKVDELKVLIQEECEEAVDFYRLTVADYVLSHKESELEWFLFLSYDDDIIWESDILWCGPIEKDSLWFRLVYRDASGWVKLTQSNYESIQHDEDIVFADSEEKIFESKIFEKYISRSCKEMAEYLGIQESQLYDYISGQMGNDYNKLNLEYSVSSGVAGCTTLSTIRVIQENYGSVAWYQTIIGSRDVRKFGNRYVSDIDKLIRSYYKSKVESVYNEKEANGEKFVKCCVMRECRTGSPAEDYQAICYLYNIDIVYQMYRRMQREYYKNFSLDQITNQSLVSRNNEIIAELKDAVKSKEKIISSLHRENDKLKQESKKRDDSKQKPLREEISKLNRTIKDKDKEIAELKKRLETQNEFIEMLNTPVSETENNQVVDISKLQNKKYLFVGYMDDYLPDLKIKFRDSVFMTSDTMSLSDIKVDAVICLIRYMSHPMLYKVKSASCLKNVPVVYCTKRGITSVYRDMLSVAVNN